MSPFLVFWSCLGKLNNTPCGYLQLWGTSDILSLYNRNSLKEQKLEPPTTKNGEADKSSTADKGNDPTGKQLASNLVNLCKIYSVDPTRINDFLQGIVDTMQEYFKFNSKSLGRVII